MKYILLTLLSINLLLAETVVLNVDARMGPEYVEYDITYRIDAVEWIALADVRLQDMQHFQKETERIFQDVFDKELKVQYSAGTRGLDNRSFKIDPRFLLIYKGDVVNILSMKEYLRLAVMDSPIGARYGKLLYDTLETIKKHDKL